MKWGRRLAPKEPYKIMTLAKIAIILTLSP